MVKLPYSDTLQRDYDFKNCLIHQENQSNNFTIQSFNTLVVLTLQCIGTVKIFCAFMIHYRMSVVLCFAGKDTLKPQKFCMVLGEKKDLHGLKFSFILIKIFLFM